MLGNGYCNYSCNNETCNYDDGDCGRTSNCNSQCQTSMRGDGECDDECDNEECLYDNDDCNTDVLSAVIGIIIGVGVFVLICVCCIIIIKKKCCKKKETKVVVLGVYSTSD